jgi:hypothetical protein
MENLYRALLDVAPQEWRFDESLDLPLPISLSIIESGALSLLA